MVLDCASQRTDVTNELVKKLNAKPHAKETPLVYPFGVTAPKRIETQVVKLETKHLDGSKFQMNKNSNWDAKPSTVFMMQVTNIPIHQHPFVKADTPLLNDTNLQDIHRYPYIGTPSSCCLHGFLKKAESHDWSTSLSNGANVCASLPIRERKASITRKLIFCRYVAKSYHSQARQSEKRRSYSYKRGSRNICREAYKPSEHHSRPSVLLPTC